MRVSSILAFLLLTISSSAMAGYDELNLTDDKSADPATSAVFVTERGAAFRFMLLDLISITDLSIPAARQKAVKLTRLIGRWEGIRVSPGRYRLVAKCTQATMGMNREHWMEGEIVVDAAPGGAYVLSCAPRSREEPYPAPVFRETTQDKLPRR